MAPLRARAGSEAAPQAVDAGGRNAALDGLRFVAVAAVLAWHFGAPGGRAGFLGVDVFFVLSGFLITGILLGQVERGHVRLGAFWARRIRRLAPALVLVLAAMIAWGALAASMTSRDDLRGDITGTLLYVANWHFIASSSYFNATGTESPLLHMWSLALEEQFYVLWPVTLFVVAALVRSARLRLPIVAALATAGVLVSVWRLLSLWNGGGVDRAYMGTDSRMFEPLVGAALAVLLLHRPHLGSSRTWNTAIAFAGVAVVTGGLATLGSGDGPSLLYARGGALVFALGTAALIWAVATRSSPVSAALALAPVAYLGRISYGIYLWHWPLIVWAAARWHGLGSGFERSVVLTAATIAIASLSYHAVEKPIRYGAIGARLRGVRIVVALAAVIGTLIAVNASVVVPHAGAQIQLPGHQRGTAPVSVTKTIVLVGDSVPQELSEEFSSAAAKHGYVVIRATAGGCPATGAEKYYSNGKPFRTAHCPKVVPPRQDAAIAKYRPALVVWWSRYELAWRVGGNGKVLRLGSKAYERRQQASFDKRVHALTRLGARLVAIQIEPPGHQLAVRNPGEHYFLVGQTMLHHPGVAKKWNSFLARHTGPRVFSISVRDLACRGSRSPCDDRLPNGHPARPDGIHYSREAGRILVPQILTRALHAAGLEPSAALIES